MNDLHNYTCSGLFKIAGHLPRFVLLCLMLLGPATTVSAQDKPVYTVAVVPQLSPLKTHKSWAPFVERLEKDTGLKLKLIIYNTVPEFEVDLLSGKPDFAFMNPYHQIMAMKPQGYIPLIHDSLKPIYGIVVVASDGPIKTAQDLNGKEIAFPSPNAYAASLYVRALLSEELGIKYTPRYLATHTDVYRYVILGKTMAGGAVNTTLERESDNVRAQLRVLYTTPASAPHPLSAHPRVPESARQAIQAAILALGADPTQAKLLQGVQLMQPIKAEYARDYLPLEKLGLEKYIVTSH